MIVLVRSQRSHLLAIHLHRRRSYEFERGYQRARILLDTQSYVKEMAVEDSLNLFGSFENPVASLERAIGWGDILGVSSSFRGMD